MPMPFTVAGTIAYQRAFMPHIGYCLCVEYVRTCPHMVRTDRIYVKTLVDAYLIINHWNKRAGQKGGFVSFHFNRVLVPGADETKWAGVKMR